MSTFDIPNGVYMDPGLRLFYQEGAKMTDGFPEELRSVLHPHWEQFAPQHPLIPYIFGVFLFALSFISLVGNFLLLYVFLSTKDLRTPTNMFTVNLALSDFLMMITHCPLVAFNAFANKFFMWGPLGCKLYGCLGGIFGTASILSMVVVGYDRFNVIVKGLNGQKITKGQASIALLGIWTYSILCATAPFYANWGGYGLEGFLLTCTYDFYTEDWNHKSFILFAFIMHWVLPMICIVFFYSRIASAVISHEATLRVQAKKMNVESLRANQNSEAESAEMRIAKVAITNVLIWALAFTPYAIVCLIGCFGNRSLVTPLVCQLPSMFLKTACCFNPLVFAGSHPKFREALAEKFPSFGINEKSNGSERKKSVTETAVTGRTTG